MLKKLCDASGVSGNESEVRDLIIEAVKPYCDSLKLDKMGNLIAYKKGTNKKSPKIMIAAHMDEVGFMVKGIDEYGALMFSPVGGIDSRVLIGKRIVIGKDRMPGVISYKPIHMQRENYEKIPKIDELRIDVGAIDKKDAEKYNLIGEYIMFDTEFEENGNLLKGKAFDDRFGCYALIELLKKKHKNNIYAVFTTQEEVGLRGAGVAAYNIMPDYALIFEATSAADLPMKKDLADIPIMGGGIAITISDRTFFTNKELLEKAEKIAKMKKIPYQFKQPMIGGTDAGRIHITGKGVKAIVLAVPCRYIHSPVGFANKQDLNGMIKLGNLLINDIK